MSIIKQKWLHLQAFSLISHIANVGKKHKLAKYLKKKVMNLNGIQISPFIYSVPIKRTETEKRRGVDRL